VADPYLGESIRKIRASRGISRKDLTSNIHGISTNGLYFIENDYKCNPKLSTLLLLAEAIYFRLTIDPYGVTIEPVEPTPTGIVCDTCGREQIRFEKGWQDGNPKIAFCPEHVWFEPEEEADGDA
jgi:DNA-binding XRE family transcriptional regulator